MALLGQVLLLRLLAEEFGVEGLRFLMVADVLTGDGVPVAVEVLVVSFILRSVFLVQFLRNYLLNHVVVNSSVHTADLLGV